MKGEYFLSFDDDSASGLGLFALPRRALRSLALSSPIRARLEARYEREFANTGPPITLFRGVYPSYDEAARSAPPTKPLGYDHPGPAAMYRHRFAIVNLTDYPVLFWLAKILPGARRLFDLGGHVGVRYFSFRDRLALPGDLVWQVMDVPAVAEAGRLIAEEMKAPNLQFTSRREDLAGADVLYASGSLQYLERPLHEILAPIPLRPPHVLVNAMPMRSGPAYYTVQSIGTAFCPYRIEDRDGLVRGMAALGYEKVDEWDVPEKMCAIPFHPASSVRGYQGMYFRAR